ncbi:MAG: glutathione S-transferase family protein [Phormidium tanganyikae FI6-MK23]|nr:glutathione S-transferase family protein [Phormidium tanganyikae FI6-MK23]
MPSVSRLITFRISHYCEKARWALDRLGSSYVEECHLPPLHRFTTTPLGGSSVPVLVTEAGVFKDSAEILNYADELTSVDSKLYPPASELRQEVEQLEAKFNHRLGIVTRQWGYFYGLQDRELMQRLWCESVPKWDRVLFPVVFPVTKYLAHRSYHISAESANTAYRQTQQIFKTVSDRLADGRKYLVGERFSAADLTFACLAAPMLLPAEYGGVFPTLNQLPNEMTEQIQFLRETVAGSYVLRLYREERHAPKCR